MKKAWVFAAVLLFVSVAGFAQTPSKAPLSSEVLAAILGQPAGSCGTQQNELVFAAKRPKGWEKSLCNATANCSPGTVSCGGNNSVTSCSAADRNCAVGERGHVTCDGVTTWCPTTCPAPCSTGTVIQRACCQCDLTGDCFNCCRCDGGSGPHCALQCG
ncbi:MAG TPA: hypothetical protein VF173_31125 [Thermoanaerobaculia bacterium]|nr:hypothetical protein [Thermoanaerobaculia bacterium]